jgi:hypothetical protein
LREKFNFACSIDDPNRLSFTLSITYSPTFSTPFHDPITTLSEPSEHLPAPLGDYLEIVLGPSGDHMTTILTPRHNPMTISGIRTYKHDLIN